MARLLLLAGDFVEDYEIMVPFQALQAMGCRVPLSVHMNPVLLKPETDTGAQVIVQGKRFGTMRAREYGRQKETLLPKVLESFSKTELESDLVLSLIHI